jgi:chlorite dismutase
MEDERKNGNKKKTQLEDAIAHWREVLVSESRRKYATDHRMAKVAAAQKQVDLVLWRLRDEITALNKFRWEGPDSMNPFTVPTAEHLQAWSHDPVALQAVCAQLDEYHAALVPRDAPPPE